MTLMTKFESRVISVINRHDPIKLICMGAPKDEYISEARMIIENFNEINQRFTAKDFQLMIFDIFTSQFGYSTAGKFSDYKELALDLLGCLAEDSTL